MALLALPNFPIRDQLGEGPGAQNAQMDCVFDSFAACVEKLTGAKYSGDNILDFVKGPTYRGAGDAAWLQGDVARHFGVVIEPFKSADQHRLISAIRDYLAQGVPCLITIPSAWNSQPTRANYTPLKPWFPTHVCAAYAIDSALSPTGSATFMNPWHGVRQTETVAWLQARLCYGAIWPVRLLPSAWRDVAIMPGWEDNGTQLRRKGGTFVLIRGFRAWALLHPEMFSGLLANNEPLENEHAAASVSTQKLRYVQLIWTPGGGVQLMANAA